MSGVVCHRAAGMYFRADHPTTSGQLSGAVVEVDHASTRTSMLKT